MTLTTQHRLLAVAIALLVHIALGALLYVLQLHGKKIPPVETELLLIDIGNVDAAKGQEEPMGRQVIGEQTMAPVPRVPAPRVSPKPITSPTQMRPTTAQPERIQTQQHEESLRIAAEERAERERIAAEERARAAEEAKRQAQRSQAGNAVTGAFGAGRGVGTSHGNAAAGTGNQGNPQGAAGGTFSLAGRTIVSNGGRLIPPTTSRAIRGRISVRIIVNAAGRVTEAQVQPQGTDIGDEAIRRAAIQAARTTVFDTAEGAEEQRGIITYHFDIQ